MAKRQKLIGILIFITLVSAITGCGGKNSGLKESVSESSSIKVSDDFNPTGLPIMKRPISLHVMVGHPAMAKKNFSDKEFYKKISEETNVNIEWEEVRSPG